VSVNNVLMGIYSLCEVSKTPSMQLFPLGVLHSGETSVCALQRLFDVD